MTMITVDVNAVIKTFKEKFRLSYAVDSESFSLIDTMERSPFCLNSIEIKYNVMHLKGESEVGGWGGCPE
jgi:hypothetical protein